MSHAFTLPIPVIETERLVLRGPEMDDLPALTAYFATERSRFTGGPATATDAARTLFRMAGHWHFRGYGLWMIEDRETGSTAGWTGILNNVGWPEPELGWTVFEGFEGRGLAGEAARAARRHAADHFGIETPISLIDPRNHRSAALAERLGARIERSEEVLGTLCDVWRHPRVQEAAA